MLETIFVAATDLRPESSVTLVTGGALLGFDDQVHIDLDRAHTVLSPNEARQFAAQLIRMADAMDSVLQCRFDCLDSSKSKGIDVGA